MSEKWEQLKKTGLNFHDNSFFCVAESCVAILLNLFFDFTSQIFVTCCKINKKMLKI